jgi:hypothetical protein
MAETREDFVYMAKLAEQAERCVVFCAAFHVGPTAASEFTSAPQFLFRSASLP